MEVVSIPQAHAWPDRERSILDLYSREISQIPLLTPAAEVELAREIAAGRKAQKQLADMPEGPAERQELAALVQQGQEARDRLVESNLRLVAAMARKHLGHGVPLLDLLQEGSMGLMRAAEKFDHRRGLRFSTYAHAWIQQTLGRAVANQARLIRLPVHASEQLTAVSRAEQTLTAELGREPTMAELAAGCGLSLSRLHVMLRAAGAARSLEGPVGEDGDAWLADSIPDPDVEDAGERAEEADLRSRLEEALQAVLTGRELSVVRLRFGLDTGEPMTLRQAAHPLGLSPERVRQVEASALRKLRGPQNQARFLALRDCQ